ncbi:hypothetical protein [Nocardia brasiliensis]|uniref:Uncharacterized protein n=1 Tax=Nocardia brasiliensis (strain ATCC 700358 / HUJEG-1) TaxID=1133849 RepID=K0ET67_NOCB7|nr:hypothetical protein [Nocardia brasiliensis]AFU00065.1 hypothetical protein O3I_010520 [Nocardia brasiliensis ATCC 700358]OCF86259.1 hypothetical protein AW168_31280 [Nocardia brasiliensis]
MTGPDRPSQTIRVGGIPISLGPPPAVWRSASVAAVAEVTVAVGPGVSVTVDAADPGTVLAWSVAAQADPAPLAGACTDDVTALVAQVRAGLGTAADTPLRLRPAWTRRALIAAVSQRFPVPLHEGALLLDAAAADQGVGHSALAAVTLGWAAPVLDALATASLTGELTGAAVATLNDVAQQCKRAAAGVDVGTDVTAIADQLARRQAADAERRLGPLLEWLARSGDSASAFTLGGDTDPGGTPAGLPEEVDLLAVPARILRWAGSREPEIRVLSATRAGDGGHETARVQVPLADQVDTLCREAGVLRAYAADGQSGRLLCTATMQVRDRILVGDIRFRRRYGDDPVFGVFSAELGPGVLRCTPTGRALRSIDRLMIDAWSAHRGAVAAAAATDPDAPDAIQEQLRGRAEGMLVRARSLTNNALDRLEVLAARVSPDDELLGDQLDARLDAIDGYISTLEGSALHLAPGTEPLLAEQVPADDAEGERA